MLFLSDVSMAEESNWFYDILVLIFSKERAEIFAKYIEKFGLPVALVFIVIILFLLYKHREKVTHFLHFINHKPTKPTPKANYLPRKDAETAVKALLKGNHSVLLSAGDGEGKTTLARKLYDDLEEEYSARYWVNYRHDIADSFLATIPTRRWNTIEEQLNELLNELCHHEKVLIVIDNLEELHDKYQILRYLQDKNKAHADILILSQLPDLEGFKSYSLDKLSVEEARWLFYIHCKRFKIGHRFTVNRLTALVNRNALGIMLLAKAVPQNGTLWGFYRFLNQQGFDSADLTKTLALLSTLSELTPQQQNTLRSFSLLPTIELPEQVTSWMQCDTKELKQLAESGWLSRRFDKRSYCHYSMHPLIQKLLWMDTTGFSEDVGSAFIAQLANQQFFSEDEPYRTFYAKLEVAEGFLENWKQWLPAETAQFADACNYIGYHCNKRALYQKAVEWNQIAVGILETILPESASLATSYNDLGYTYGELGDHQKALQYQLDALNIRKKVLPPDHPSLATSYNNVGTTYGKLGDHQKALQYQLDALEICKKVLPPDHPDLATSYNNVGYTYGALGDHQKALQYQLKDLAICQKVLPPDHPDLASSYHNVGATLYQLKRYQEAREHLLKAVAIYDARPECRFDLPNTYLGLSKVEAALGNTAAAEKYRQKYLTLKQQLENERNT